LWYITGILEMAETERVICSSDVLQDSGPGMIFVAEHSGETVPAFVVRYEGQVHAFVNRCPHSLTGLHSFVGLQPQTTLTGLRRFFESRGRLLSCPVHGATFLPDSGKCVSGPCFGESLIAIAVEERDGKVIAKDSGAG